MNEIPSRGVYDSSYRTSTDRPSTETERKETNRPSEEAQIALRKAKETDADFSFLDDEEDPDLIGLRVLRTLVKLGITMINTMDNMIQAKAENIKIESDAHRMLGEMKNKLHFFEAFHFLSAYPGDKPADQVQRQQAADRANTSMNRIVEYIRTYESQSKDRITRGQEEMQTAFSERTRGLETITRYMTDAIQLARTMFQKR